MFNRLAHHMDLMIGMFRQTGAMGGAAFDASCEPALRQALFRCAGCRDTEACRSWLDESSSGQAPPDFCRNQRLIERLQAAAS